MGLTSSLTLNINHLQIAGSTSTVYSEIFNYTHQIGCITIYRKLSPKGIMRQFHLILMRKISAL